MRISAIVAVVAAVLSVSEAKINGIAVPATIRPGDGFNAIIESSNWIQSIYDVAIVFGYAPGKGYPGDLGTVLGSYYLGPEQSNQLTHFSKWVTTPSNAPLGPAVLCASLTSLIGAAAAPILTQYNVSITFGPTTSTTYLMSAP